MVHSLDYTQVRLACANITLTLHGHQLFVTTTDQGPPHHPTHTPRTTQPTHPTSLSATDGESWTGSKSGWLSGSAACCSYSGITCDTNGHVVELDLSNRGLHGTIPTQFGYLSTLTSGNPSGGTDYGLLDYNYDLTGALPSQIGQLTRMKDTL